MKSEVINSLTQTSGCARSPHVKSGKCCHQDRMTRAWGLRKTDQTSKPKPGLSHHSNARGHSPKDGARCNENMQGSVLPDIR